MPRILNLKTDENSHVWCDLGRLSDRQGSVMVLTEEELSNIKRQERMRIAQIVQFAVDDPDKIETATNPF